MTIENPAPKVRRIGRLHTIGHVISELGRVYRQARKGEITSADASRFAQILALMRQGMEAGLIEQRIAELERASNDRRAPVQHLRAV